MEPKSVHLLLGEKSITVQDRVIWWRYDREDLNWRKLLSQTIGISEAD